MADAYLWRCKECDHVIGLSDRGENPFREARTCQVCTSTGSWGYIGTSNR